MASPVNPPRGMRDFLPAEKARRERVLGVIRSTYSVHGFDEIETPVMEDGDRLHSGLGGDNEKLAFAVMKRGLTPGDFADATEALDLADLGLRFDLTVPLARFYATHRAELPTVFRSIQIAPVWRAERPQKGRYRQFVQCDIDIIGEPGTISEIELLTATAATLDALGLTGSTIRINDRRLLVSALALLGFPSDEHDAVLISVDKLDKIGREGVVAELRDRGLPAAPVDSLDGLLASSNGAASSGPLTEDVVRAALPDGVDPVAVRDLVAIADALDAGRAAPLLRFDPWLVRGMGYYTGAIFEVAHPSLGYSLGGGGRYDGMIGRFLGSDVPAAGFSLGFERIVDLVDLPDEGRGDAAALVHDPEVSAAVLVGLKTSLVRQGVRTTLVPRPRNMRPLLESLAAQGYTRYASVTTEGIQEFRDLA